MSFLTLRDYQSQAVSRIMDAVAQRVAAILVLPTGAGKTEIAAATALKLKDQGKRILFSVDRATLLDQAASRFEKYGLSVGLIGNGHNTATAGNDVVVVTIQTLKSRFKRLKKLDLPGEFDVCFVDEAHTNHRLESELHKLMPVIGMTATPHGHHIEDAYEEMIKVITIPDLIGMEFLVPATLYAPRQQIDLSSVGYSAGEYRLNDMAESAAKIQGDIVANWKRLASDRPTLVFASNVEHADQLARGFTAEGVTAASITYTTTRGDVTDILNKFEAGDLQVITSVNKIAAGFDAPWASCVVLARATASECLYIQMVGRGLRPYEGKENCLLLDHGRNASRFGHPMDYVPPELHEASERATPRFQGVEKAHFCVPCGAELTSRYAICKSCGAKPAKPHPRNITVPEPSEAWLDKVELWDDLDDVHALGAKAFYQQTLLYARAFNKSEKMAFAATKQLFPNEWPQRSWNRVPKHVQLSEMVAGHHKKVAADFRKRKQAEKRQEQIEARKRHESMRQAVIQGPWKRDGKINAN